MIIAMRMERSTGCAVMVSVLLSLVFVTACLHGERTYGIYHTAKLSSYPDAKCVASALRKVQGIENVEQTEYVTTRGLRDLTGSYTRGFRRTVGLAIFEEPTHASFAQTYAFVNKKPSANDIREARELMKDVELTLERECHLNQLTRHVKEECDWIDCAPD
jgi:hypothetical protein